MGCPCMHPSIPPQFSCRVEPRFTGTGIFSEIIYERCFRLGPTIRPKRQRNGSAGASPPRLQWICTERDLQDGGREAFGRAEWKRLSDIVHMEESKQSRSGEGPGPQDRPLKEAEDPLKEKAISPGQQAGEKAAEDQETEELARPGRRTGNLRQGVRARQANGLLRVAPRHSPSRRPATRELARAVAKNHFRNAH